MQLLKDYWKIKMNDFTKAELIKLAVLCARAQMGETDLYLKLDNMIANYCEHSDFRKDTYKAYICNKCDKVIE